MTNVNPAPVRKTTVATHSVGTVLAAAFAILALVLFVIAVVHSGLDHAVLKEIEFGGIALALSILSFIFLP